MKCLDPDRKVWVCTDLEEETGECKKKGYCWFQQMINLDINREYFTKRPAFDDHR